MSVCIWFRDVRIAYDAVVPSSAAHQPLRATDQERAEIRDYVARTRAEQGLPRYIEDRPTMIRLARILNGQPTNARTRVTQ